MPNPTTAAEWATYCHQHAHWIAWSAGQGGAEKILCFNCANAYARQQVEAFRERAPFEAYGCWLRSWEVGSVWNYPMYWVGACCRDRCHRKEYRISADELAATYMGEVWAHLQDSMFADLAVAHMREAAAIRALPGGTP